MTPERLAEIKARHAAASPGPWVDDGYSTVFSDPLLEHDEDAPRYPSKRRPYRLWQETNGQQGAPYPSPEDQAWLDQRDAAYEADPVVCHVPAHHGDTAIGRHDADAQFIAHAWQDIRDVLAFLDDQAALRERIDADQAARAKEREEAAMQHPAYTMAAGPELDRLVAERVYDSAFPPVGWVSTLSSGVFDTLTHMQWRGFYCRLTSPFAPGGRWHCGFTRQGVTGWNGRPDWEAHGETVALAVCRAAVIAVDGWREVEEGA